MILRHNLAFGEQVVESFTLAGRELIIIGSACRHARKVKFYVTNLKLPLPIELPALKGMITPVKDHRLILQDLRASRGVKVTAEACFRVHSRREVNEIVTAMDDSLCPLLSLAHGTRTQWICYEILDREGAVLQSYHWDAITKPYSTLELIPTIPPSDTEDFLTSVLTTLPEQDERWDLRKAIMVYTDGKAESDFLEQRALKIAIAAEHLKGSYLRKEDSVTILPPERFDEQARTLQLAVKEALQAAFPEATKDEITLMATHTAGMNWYTFARALSHMCKEIGLRISSAERRKFKEIRDRLVHTAAFHERHGTPWEQYSFLLTFVGKLLLAILGYQGHYYDWTKKPGWEGASPMRTLLTLQSLSENRHH